MNETELDKPKTRENRPASHAPGESSFSKELLAGMRAWARHTFSIASLLSGLKSLLWVAPLSVIIWVYAEQNDVLPETVRTVVTVESADPSRTVRLLEPADGKVSFTITGSNTNRQKVKDLLDSLPAIQLELQGSALATPGDRDVPAAMINDSDLFRSNGVAVSEVSPPTLRFNVDIVDDVEVDVQPAPDGANFSAVPIFTPRKVHVKAPHSVIEAARAANKFVAYAHLDEAREALTPGPHDLTVVPVTIPFGDKNVTIVPSTVLAHVEIKRSDVSYTIPAVAVRVTYPSTIDDKLKAICDTKVTDITVTGPPELIRAMKDPNFQPQPYARLEVEPKDAADTTYERQLQFQLPTGIQISPESEKTTIPFHLTERRTNE
jgi:hypothetical protein